MKTECGRPGHQGLVTMCHACEVACRKERDALRTSEIAWKVVAENAVKERNDAVLQNEAMRNTLKNIASLAIELSDCPDGCPAGSMQREAQRALVEKPVGEGARPIGNIVLIKHYQPDSIEKRFCEVEIYHPGGDCGRPLPCPEHPEKRTDSNANDDPRDQMEGGAGSLSDRVGQ